MSGVERASFQIIFQPSGKRGNYQGPIRLLDAARRVGVGLESVCGGVGECGRCKMIVIKGSTSHLTGIEEMLLTEEEVKQGYRLACCTKVYGDAEVLVPPSVALERQRLQVEAVEMPLQVEPVVREYVVELPEATLVDICPDFGRLREALKATHGVEPEVIDYHALRALSPVIREGEWSLSVALRGGEVIAVSPGASRRVSLGLAVDLGTTKIALYLVDLSTGQTIDMLGIQNPQIPYG
ncbi:MAG: ferredoxin, partial [Chloroflexi bacterium]